MSECRHFFIAGHVQGVFFRAATQQFASSVQLRGWVRNLPDGRVEVEACGQASQLDLLQEWLWQGPQYASVTEVIVEPGTGDGVGEEFIVTV